jgi:hypothetical protein
MGNRKDAQKKKRKAEQARRQAERLRNPQTARVPPAPEAAFLELRPQASQGEAAEDVAILDAAVRGTLTADLQAQAGLVCEALELVAGGHLDPAVDRLSSIGRSSPFSEWRLFVRGLAAFQQGDPARARDAWSRLDAARRPSRIAKVLGGAWEAVQGGEPTTAATGGGTATGSPAAAARTLLARASMWEAAERVAGVRHRNPDQTFSASQVATTVRLVEQYRSLDPDFTATFAVACRQLASQQPDAELFASLARGTGGLADDPNCRREIFVYLQKFHGASKDAMGVGRHYIDRELPALRFLPSGLRQALASGMLRMMASHAAGDSGADSLRVVQGTARKQVEQLLEESIERFAMHRRAHSDRLAILEGKASTPGSGKRAAAKQLREAQIAYAERFPEDHEHLITVIEALVGEEQFRRAEPFVQHLLRQRSSHPRAATLPWSFAIQRLAHLAGTAASAAELEPVWDAVTDAWPQQVPHDWMLLLDAALETRSGSPEASAFEQAIADAGGAERPLVLDAMAHEALRVAAVAKELRDAYGERVARAGDADAVDMPLEPLVEAAAFYRTLQRCGVDVLAKGHPAASFGTRLCKRLTLQSKWKLGGVLAVASSMPTNQEAFWDAFEWLGEHDFFGVVTPKREPKAISQLADAHPRAAAEMLAWRTRVAPESLLTPRSKKRIRLLEDVVPEEEVFQRSTRAGTILADAYEAQEQAEQQKRLQRRSGSPAMRAGLGSGLDLSDFDTSEMPPLLELLLKRGGTAALAEALSIIAFSGADGGVAEFSALAKRLGIGPQELASVMMANMAWEAQHGEF